MSKTYYSLKELLESKAIENVDKQEFNVCFVFKSGKTFDLDVGLSNYKPYLREDDSPDGYTSFFKELQIDKPCRWINENVYKVEISQLKSECDGDELNHFPEAIDSITRGEYERLFTLLYNQLDYVNTGVTDKTYNFAGNHQQVAVKSANCSIPTIPNLNPTGFSLTINLTA